MDESNFVIAETNVESLTPVGPSRLESIGSLDDIVVDCPSQKKRKTSKAWDHFDEEEQKNEDGSFMRNEDGSVLVKAVCRICGQKYCTGGTSGTKHLLRHMESCLRRTSSVGQQTQISRGPDGVVYTFKFSQERARRETARYWVREELPFMKVEKPSFIRFMMRTHGPQFKPPCRITLRNDIMLRFGEEKAALKELFQGVPGKISFTSDMWTSNQKLGYLCITAHYIGVDWRLRKLIICFIMLPSPHTGKSIANSIYNSLLGWNICDKIGTFTMDNASCNDVALSRLKELCFGEGTLSRELIQIRCNAHVTNLLVKDGLKHVKTTLENIRESILHVKSSQAKLEKFFESCRNMGIKERRLPMDVETRWDSTYLMLEAAIPYKGVFQDFFDDSDFKYIPTDVDWNNAIIVRDFFKVFKDSTKLFSGTKYVTSSAFCYQLSTIACVLKRYAGVPCFRLIYNDMKLKYDKYWKDVPLILGLASCMDPRYKLTILELCIDLNYEAENHLHEVENEGNPVPPPSPGIKKMSHYRTKLFALFDEYQRKSSNNAAGLNDIRPPCVNEVDMVAALLMRRREASNLTSRSELERYLDQPVVSVLSTQSFDILEWWQTQECNYPVLSAMARDLLTIPVSTVASESAFSGSERVVSKYRSCLLPETVEALVCLKDWFQAEEELQNEDLDDMEDMMADLAL